MAAESLALTPRAKAIEDSARSAALERGDGHVGVEHLFLAMLDDEQSLTADVLRSLGVLEEAKRTLLLKLSSHPGPSNMAADEHGRPFGYLVDDPAGGHVLVDREGRRLTVEKTAEGTTVFRYADGSAAPPLPHDAPRMLNPEIRE